MPVKPRLTTIDFETEAISGKPNDPPKPVGLALQTPEGRSLYFAWGHPTGNGLYTLKNGRASKIECYEPEQTAKEFLKSAYRGSVLGHNIFKFDNRVAAKWGVKPATWENTHDTLFSLFLKDPHAKSLSLKPSAEKHLGVKPDERDAVYDWLADQGIIPQGRVKDGRVEYVKNAGAFISKAPGDLVAGYAIGDVTRTRDLYDLHMPEILKDGMKAAYDRERQLSPILQENEELGMRVDLPRLEKAIKTYKLALLKVEGWLRKKLGAPGLNLDSDEETAKALQKAGIVKDFPKTATGRDSVSKKNLTIGFFSEPDVYLALAYRNGLNDVMVKSLVPWFVMGSENEGYIFTDWNQVRGDAGGARSGRITCTWFANIVKQFTDKGTDDYTEAGDKRIRKLIGLPELPLAREFCLPDPGDQFGHIDYNQQELRLVAHYEEGALAEAYRTKPDTDIHTYVQQLIFDAVNKRYDRKFVKTINFRTVYGGGIAGLAVMLRISFAEAQEMVHGWRRALPDVVGLDKELKARFYEGKPLRTFGGRLYHCKPPAVAKKGPRKGQLISFEYTALNYLIQPSGADVTKQALINYYNHPKRRGRLLATVYDEVNISAPDREELRVLQESMESVKLDVPWQTQSKLGPSWGAVEKV